MGTVQQAALTALLAASPVMLPIPVRSTGCFAHLADNAVKLGVGALSGWAVRG
jgi:hypothetical protein